MVRSGETTSNALFETLVDWEEQFKDLDIDFDEAEDKTANVADSDWEGPTP